MLCLSAKRVAVLSSLLVFITAVQYLILCVLYEQITLDSDSRQLVSLTRSLATVRWTDEWQSNENRTKVTATFYTVSQVVPTVSHGIILHKQHSSDILPTQEKQLARDKRDRVSVASKHTLGFGLDAEFGARGTTKQPNLHTDQKEQLRTGNVDQRPRVSVPTTSMVQHVNIEGNHHVDHVDRGKEQLFRDSERNRRLKEALETELHQEATQPEDFKRHLSLKELRKRSSRLRSTSEPRLVSQHLHVGNMERHDHRLGMPHSNDFGEDSMDRRHQSLAMQRTRIVLNQPERSNNKLPMEKFAGNSQQYLMELCGEKLEPLVECSDRVPRKLSPLEREGRNIMFTMRTTVAYHKQRLPLLFQTWLTTVSPDTVFIVTDGHDPVLEDETRSRGKPEMLNHDFCIS